MKYIFSLFCLFFFALSGQSAMDKELTLTFTDNGSTLVVYPDECINVVFEVLAYDHKIIEPELKKSADIEILQERSSYYWDDGHLMFRKNLRLRIHGEKTCNSWMQMRWGYCRSEQTCLFTLMFNVRSKK